MCDMALKMFFTLVKFPSVYRENEIETERNGKLREFISSALLS